MLVLTRKLGETIQIGDSITITVLRMKGKGVRLGIQAPQDFNVIRGELTFEHVVEEQKDAENSEPVANYKFQARRKGIRQDGSWSPKDKQPAVDSTAPCAWSI